MNIVAIRDEIMACHDKIFINSAGSSLPPMVVNEAIYSYLRGEEMIGGYAYAATQQPLIQDFYHQAAILLNTTVHNIAFQTSATDAYAKAFSSIPLAENEYILTTNDDYISNQIAMLALAKRQKVVIVRANNLENGDLDLEDFEAKIKQYAPKLVSVSHIPTNSGKIQDILAIGQLCQQYDIWYIVDACQSVGQMEVDVQAIGCDFLTATGRKFVRGPRGTGFLYISDKALAAGLEPAGLDMKGAEWTATDAYKIKPNASRFEYWEANYALVVGLGAALKYINSLGIKNIDDRNRFLQHYFRNKLREIPNLRLLDEGSQLCSIITFRIEGKTLQEIEHLLNTNKVYYSVSTKSNALIDFTHKKVDWAIRFSPHYFNTTEELDEVCSILKENT